MATRNFIQQGLAYGATPASVTVSFDGVQIYSGPVPTVDQPTPPMPGSDIEDTAYTWTLPAEFNGPINVVLQVSGSTFILADTLTDRIYITDPTLLNTVPFGQTIDGVFFYDPFTNVQINGISMTRDSNAPGQWYWKIEPGQTFSATLNIPVGITYPDWDPAQSYPTMSNVVYQNHCYSDGETAAAPGLVPSSNPETWFTLPVPLWDINNSYPIYARVQAPSGGYMALQAVPAGVPITDTTYWVLRIPAP